jgi:uroporphyrinogen decarboxylase
MILCRPIFFFFCQVFESHAEYLNRDLAKTFCVPYWRKIRQRLRSELGPAHDVPVVLFPKGGSFSYEDVKDLGYQVVGVDWTVEPAKARDVLGPDVTLQGNLDPCALYAPSGELEKRAKEMVRAFGKGRYIANLGHGIYPDVNPDAVQVFIDAVHSAFE